MQTAYFHHLEQPNLFSEMPKILGGSRPIQNLLFLFARWHFDLPFCIPKVWESMAVVLFVRRISSFASISFSVSSSRFCRVRPERKILRHRNIKKWRRRMEWNVTDFFFLYWRKGAGGSLHRRVGDGVFWTITCPRDSLIWYIDACMQITIYSIFPLNCEISLIAYARILA